MASDQLASTLTGVCDRCLGRALMGAQGQAVQQEAGAAHRQTSGVQETAERDCVVCEGAFAAAATATWLALALDALAPYAFDTFQVGTVFPAALEAREKALGLNPELGDSMRTEANRMLGPQIAEATGARWETAGRPDVVVTVDTRFWHAEARANAIFLAGRYTKHRRDIPQTHWPCKRCNGRGCWECDDTGVMYAESVEDAIAEHAVASFGAAGASFHGAGREDIDALMLGTGRPFVLELHDPKKRSVDLDALAAAVNEGTASSGVGVGALRMTEKEEVARIKGADYDKEYVAHCIAEQAVARADVERAAAALSGSILDQRTPERVAHRRADKVRKRTVHRLNVEEMAADPGERFTLRVLAESGTYIKEMVSGDEGRTVPSLAAELGAACNVETLDVVGVYDDVQAAPSTNT